MGQVYTEAFAAELVNRKKAHFQEMSKEAQCILLKLNHLVEDYSRDMREWRRTTTDHRQWKLERQAQAERKKGPQWRPMWAEAWKVKARRKEQ